MKDFENWMYEFALNGKNEAQSGINIIDNKAMSIINFSSLLIPITTGILFFISGKIEYPIFVKILLTGSIGFFLLTIIFGFAVLWLRGYGIIPIKEHFIAIDEKIEKNDDDSDEISIALGETSHDIADWQENLLKISKNKGKYFITSSVFFVTALLIISLSGALVLYYMLLQ